METRRRLPEISKGRSRYGSCPGISISLHGDSDLSHMNLSEMRHLLKDREIRLTKSLGQNFLHDAHQLERIVAAAELMPADKVLEIGPGLGHLTGRLIREAGEVLAIEKDARLVKILKEQFGHHGGESRLDLLHADALDLLKEEGRDWSGWKVVSNLPYSVASPILVQLCQGPRSPRMMVATLQLEVAQRLMSEPGNKDYGVLGLLVQLDFEPVRWFRIPAGSFFPQPDVDSACIVLKRRSTELLPQELRPAYVRVVKRAFSQRRKMMLKLLKQDWEPKTLDAAFNEIALSPQVRAEAVGLRQFVQLTRRLAMAGNNV